MFDQATFPKRHPPEQSARSGLVRQPAPIGSYASGVRCEGDCPRERDDYVVGVTRLRALLRRTRLGTDDDRAEVARCLGVHGRAIARSAVVDRPIEATGGERLDDLVCGPRRVDGLDDDLEQTAVGEPPRVADDLGWNVWPPRRIDGSIQRNDVPQGAGAQLH